MFDKNMMEKLQQMQQQASVSKEKLANVKVNGEAGGNLISVEMDGNRKLTNLEINAPLDQIEKEDLEDLLSVALNRALDAAEKVNEKEMQQAAKGILPGM